MCIEEKNGGTLAQLARLSEMDRDTSLCFSAADYPLPRRSVHLARHVFHFAIWYCSWRAVTKESRSISSQFCGHRMPTRRSASLVLDCNTNRERGNRRPSSRSVMG